MDLTQDEAQAQLDEMLPLTESLFDMSEVFLKKRGSFLPHGASMNNFDQITIVNAMPENDYTNSEEVLPLLHEGLRDVTKEASTLAVAVCEYVYIGVDQTPAIKVLAEHRGGLCAALYLPFKTRFLRAPSYGEPQMVVAAPEVGGWSDRPVTFPTA